MCFYLSDVALWGPDSPPQMNAVGQGSCPESGRKPQSMAAEAPAGKQQRGQAPRPGPDQALSASVVKLSPQPHSAVAFGFLNVNVSLSPCLPKSISVPSTRPRLSAST